MSDQPDHSTRQAGKIMMILAWLALFGVLIAFFAHWEENTYNPNRTPESRQNATENSVVLQRNRYHHYVTKGEINQKPVVFLLDTGASDVVVPATLEQTLQLNKGKTAYAKTANGTITVYKTHIDQLTIGSITLYDIEASINPSMDGESILLGMSALKNIEFTQRGEQLTLKQYR
jgi:aspartyl protease family protein